MIRTNISQKNCQFLPNRPGIDQDGYRVGTYKEQVIVQNIETGEIMDYFYDDSELDWFSLGLIDKSIEGYYIKRDGTVKGIKKILAHYCSSSGYPSCLIKRSSSYFIGIR